MISVAPRNVPLHDVYPYRVLVVDDDPVQRELEQELLPAPKYHVTMATGGAEALALLATQTFDVVLLDKRMPGLDGDETCRRLRRDLAEHLLPVIMVTGNSAHDEMGASLRAGADDFVRKPYHPLELVARVDTAVGRKRLTDQLDNAESLLFTLARLVEAKDEGTGDHCSRLAHAGVVFGRALGLSPDELLALRRGGVLHDVGKIGVPDRILLKRGALTDEEWVLMRAHTVTGERLCAGLKSMRATLPIIRSHHERWDGSGYPDGLKKEEIPLLARVFQIVDVYDALASARPYKPAWPLERIVATLEQEAQRGWRDPGLTSLFLDILRQRPQDLALPPDTGDDLGASLAQEILATGAIELALPMQAAG